MRAAIAGLRELGRGPFRSLLAVSLAAWAVLLVRELADMRLDLCLSPVALGLTPAGVWTAATRTATPPVLAFDWAVMLTAMTAPLLGRPLAHLRGRSLAERRGRAVALFVVGHLAVWMAALVALALAAAVLDVIARGRVLPSLLVVSGLALAWPASAQGRRWLNRCQLRPALAPFGLRAEWASLRFGASSALVCAATCWPLMLMPFVAGRAHLWVMLLVAVLILAQRFGAMGRVEADRPRMAVGGALVLAGLALLVLG